MTVFLYIMAGMVSTLIIVGSSLVVFRAGEKELISHYERSEKK